MQMYKKNAERTTPRRRTAKIAAVRPERPAWREKRAPARKIAPEDATEPENLRIFASRNHPETLWIPSNGSPAATGCGRKRSSATRGSRRYGGAEVRQVGSLRSGLLMKHRDIDFHIYSSPLRLEESFAAMAQLAADPAVGLIECRNLLATDEACVEWHATYRDRDGDEWQLDMIHIVRGSRYDGYFERVADRIAAALTPVTRRAILQLKYDTPDDVKIAGIEYYVAVLRDGVRTYDAFAEWRRTHPLTGIVEWMP